MSRKNSNYLISSITKKIFMSVTGVLLVGFIVGHMSGNTLMYFSPEAFNTYGHKLVTNPFILIIELGLATIFLIHVGMAIKLTIENYLARPDKYHMKTNTGRGATFASSTMPYTGVIILIFVILHLINFKYGPVYHQTYHGEEMRDLNRLMLEFFQNPLYIMFYIIPMLVLGLHVSHGFRSAFQSIGFNFEPYTCYIKIMAKILAVITAISFSAFPIWAYMQGGH